MHHKRRGTGAPAGEDEHAHTLEAARSLAGAEEYAYVKVVGVKYRPGVTPGRGQGYKGEEIENVPVMLSAYQPGVVREKPAG